ncbi:hypothetical protein RCS94_05400 [Orbaceae bacterium ac157xtp]
MLIAPLSYGALSATSANTIKGNAPKFKGHSGAKKLGFTVNNTYYSESDGNLSATDDNVFDAGLTPRNFQINTSLTFTVADDYEDVDGDGASSTPFTMDAITFVWKDGANRTLTNADMSKTIGCGGGLSMPLTLTITLPNVQVHSEHGDPRDSIPAVLEQSYKIAGTQGICYVRPGSLYWKDYAPLGSPAGTRSPTQGGGYTADFVPGKGFKANPTVSSVKFPTTAFPGARFQLKMTGSQTDWNYTEETNPNNAVRVDTDGWVTINNKPTGAITVRATSKSSSSTYFDYTFNPTSLWVVPTGSTWMTYAQAKTSLGCGDESKIASREQLSNSPVSRIVGGASIPNNAYTRAIGKLDIDNGAQPMKESIFSEWGWADGSTSGYYPGSQWRPNYHYYWTRDAWSASDQFHVSSSTGALGYNHTRYSAYIACLE